ncbi:hypothetical protein PILCRDRAFT_812586 [Piloderma croceum F 1598]|uniref:Uncharacterized protein n=1 Tax=Piloderma croceum (strain F 1598) TaxID=765440 RepID=A0A0C3GGM8_PILCF|nr:hypothetical protein PILCRDRAFT_812586 [Piloderma croceum F 1598]
MAWPSGLGYASSLVSEDARRLREYETMQDMGPALPVLKRETSAFVAKCVRVRLRVLARY